jgi:hypothetical protein
LRSYRTLHVVQSRVELGPNPEYETIPFACSVFLSCHFLRSKCNRDGKICLSVKQICFSIETLDLWLNGLRLKNPPKICVTVIGSSDVGYLAFGQVLVHWASEMILLNGRTKEKEEIVQL